MFIAIHCAGMAFNGKTFHQKSIGGSETACYYLAKELAARGHQVTVFTNEREECKVDGVKYVWMGNVDENNMTGDRFYAYIGHTPVDVLVIQRHLAGFIGKYQSQLNLWWLHDLALYRQKERAQSQLYNVDGVFTVSEYHKNQVSEVYDLDKDYVHVLHNGVDLSLYEDAQVLDSVNREKFNMIYSSRPERGLVNLVGPDGIMHKLLETDPDIHLYVCGYDHTAPQMKQYYEYLWGECDKLPNVTNIGALTKEQLARYQVSVDMFCYPTEFEEVSCITAMEAMAAGKPMLTSDVAVMKETTQKNVDSGTELISLNEDGHADVDAFVTRIRRIEESAEYYVKLSKKQKTSALFYKWSTAADQFENTVANLFDKVMQDKGSVMRHFMNNSDIQRLKKYVHDNVTDRDIEKNPIVNRVMEELETCYKFSESEEAYDEHYQSYYKHERDVKKVPFTLEDLGNNSRFNAVLGLIAAGDSSLSILDYGCAHGHYSYNLAKRLPKCHVTGIDISRVNIEEAKRNNTGQQEGFEELPNLEFYEGSVRGRQLGTEAPIEHNSLDVILLGEILEHVISPEDLLNTLNPYLKEDGYFVVTTPYGPWEYEGYEREHPLRAHLWHIDKCEIYKSFSQLPKFDVKCAPYDTGGFQQMRGSYVYRFGKSQEKFLSFLDAVPDKKIAPRQTISLCMIVKDAEHTIRGVLSRLINSVDEIIIGIDENTTDDTLAVINKIRDERNFWPVFKIFSNQPARQIGFDNARNATIEKANCDWIMWIDSDEKFNSPEYMHLHTRHSMVQGYMIPQHHIAIEPPGLIKTDLPVRLFRNHKGIKFFGRVHEHPELEVNKGVGFTLPIARSTIMHEGYETEDVRKGRFGRNLPLLMRNRQELEDRYLDKLLVIRDMAQMCRFEIEQGTPIHQEMKDRAKIGIDLFEELIENNARMAVDTLPYYSDLCRIKDVGFEVNMVVDIKKDTRPDKGIDISARYASKEHLQKMINVLINEKVKYYEEKYY